MISFLVLLKIVKVTKIYESNGLYNLLVVLEEKMQKTLVEFSKRHC